MSARRAFIRLALGAAVAGAISLGPDAARAWTWLSQPAPPDLDLPNMPDLPESSDGPVGICLSAILQAEARHQIPDHLLLALGLQEAGWQSPEGLTVWPWSVNAAGEGRRFDSRAEAMEFVRARQAAGVQSIDVGCLQINLRWHPQAFESLAEGFDPIVNADYAARFLRRLYDESGSWQLAAGRYHSHSEGPQATYLASLRRNQAVVSARLGELTARAGGAGPSQTLSPAAPDYRTTGAIWGAEMAGAEGAARTLYSAFDIVPILPAFLPPA